MSMNRPRNRQDLLDFMMAYWQNEVSQSTATTSKLVGIVYEIYSDPPHGMTDKERILLKTINDLEADLIRLENKFIGLGNGFSTIVLASKLDMDDKSEALSAIADFLIELRDYDMELFKIVADSHKNTMNLRSELLKDY